MSMFKLKEFVTLRTTGEAIVIQHSDGSIRFFPLDLEPRDILDRLLNDGLNEQEMINWKSPLKTYFTEQGLLRREHIQQPYRERFDLYLDYVEHKYETRVDRDLIGKKKVLVLGAGGGGAGVIYQLAQLGIRHLSVADFDIVSESDIRRSFVYKTAHVGLKKTDVLKEELSENFGTSLTVFDVKINETEIERILQQDRYDMVVNCIDPDPEHKMILNRLCHHHRTPVLFIAYSYEMLLVGPLIVPGSTSCYESYNKHVRATVDSRFDFHSITRIPSAYLSHPSVNFSINTLCSFAVRDILFFLIGKPEIVATWGTLIFLDSIGMSMDTYELNCIDCPVCQAK